MDLESAGLVRGDGPADCVLSVSISLSCCGHAFLPTCRALSWALEGSARAGVPALAPLGTAQGSVRGRATTLPTEGARVVVSKASPSIPPHSVPSGPVVLVCLIFFQAKGGMGSEARAVLALWPRPGRGPEDTVGSWPGPGG